MPYPPPYCQGGAKTPPLAKVGGGSRARGEPERLTEAARSLAEFFEGTIYPDWVFDELLEPVSNHHTSVLDKYRQR